MLLNDFSIVIKYKIDIQKSIVFLYISNEYSENEFKYIILFVIL